MDQVILFLVFCLCFHRIQGGRGVEISLLRGWSVGEEGGVDGGDEVRR